MSNDDFEELTEPGFVEGGEDSWTLRVASGRLAACAAMRDGLAGSDIGGEAAPAVAWGGADDADFSRVTGWVAVSDMDGMGGSLVPGYLLAAWWGGRLWLRYAAEVPAGESAEDEADSAAVCGDAGVMVDGMQRLRAHGRGPSLQVVPLSERDGFLKRDGRWRVDVPWEVLAVYGVHPSGELWDDASNMRQEYRVTLWMVPVGRVVCFMATSSKRYAEDGSLAPCAERMRWSEFGRMYGESVGTMGPHAPFEAALLPWEADGSEPWTGATDEWSSGYEADAMCCGRVADGARVERRAGYARPVSACGRFHDSSLLGAFMAMLGWTMKPSIEDVFGFPAAGFGEVLERGLVTAPLERVGVYECAQDYRFDPDSVEGLGLSFGFATGGYVLPEENWPPVADLYRVTLRAEIPTAGGSTLHLRLAGTEADGVLLTASMFAEVLKDWTGTEERPDGGGTVGGGGGEDNFTPEDERWKPDGGDDEEDVEADDWPGPGPRPNPDDDEDVDEDSNPDNRPAVKIGYERGAGFKSCSLVRRGGAYYWKLVLDGAAVSAALRGVEVPGQLTLKANGSQAGTEDRVVHMGLSTAGGHSALAAGKSVTGSGALAFRGSNQQVIQSSVVCKYALQLDMEVSVPDKVWYLSATEVSTAGSWVRRTASDGLTCFQARAQEWYKFSVDVAALKTAAVNELRGRVTSRRVSDSAVSVSHDSVVSGTLSGTVLDASAEATLSGAKKE